MLSTFSNFLLAKWSFTFNRRLYCVSKV